MSILIVWYNRPRGKEVDYYDRWDKQVKLVVCPKRHDAWCIIAEIEKE